MLPAGCGEAREQFSGGRVEVVDTPGRVDVHDRLGIELRERGKTGLLLPCGPDILEGFREAVKGLRERGLVRRRQLFGAPGESGDPSHGFLDPVIKFLRLQHRFLEADG